MTPAQQRQLTADRERDALREIIRQTHMLRRGSPERRVVEAIAVKRLRCLRHD